MSKKGKKRQKLNNAGLTLVELLVAILIMSIVVPLFLNAFLTSARVNAKSRIQHKATTVAQDIMEGMKANTLESLEAQFTADPESGVYPFYLIPEDVLVVEAHSENLGIFTSAEEHLHYYYLRNITMDHSVFDALITVNGKTYTNDGSSEKKYNEQEYVSVPIIDADYDAVVADAIQFDTDAVAEYGTVTSREIIVNVNNVEYGDGYHLIVSYSYAYNGDTAKTPLIAFDNSQDLTRKLNNVYVFFPPKNDWTETITINNPDDIPFHLYLIKQNVPGAEPELATNTIDVNVAQSSTIVEPKVKIFTNWETGHGVYRYYYKGSPVTDPETKFGLINDLVNHSATDKLFDVTIDVYSHVSDEVPTNMDDFLNNKVGERRASLTGTIKN